MFQLKLSAEGQPFLHSRRPSICGTRSYAALRAADLDWIVGPGYSSGRYILEKNQHGTMNNHENQPGPMKKQKRYERGVTTDQGRGGGAGINKNVTY